MLAIYLNLVEAIVSIIFHKITLQVFHMTNSMELLYFISVQLEVAMLLLEEFRKSTPLYLLLRLPFLYSLSFPRHFTPYFYSFISKYHYTNVQQPGKPKTIYSVSRVPFSQLLWWWWIVYCGNGGTLAVKWK